MEQEEVAGAGSLVGEEASSHTVTGAGARLADEELIKGLGCGDLSCKHFLAVTPEATLPLNFNPPICKMGE